MTLIWRSRLQSGIFIRGYSRYTKAGHVILNDMSCYMSFVKKCKMNYKYNDTNRSMAMLYCKSRKNIFINNHYHTGGFNHNYFLHCKNFTTNSPAHCSKLEFILNNTEITQDHMTPEISLRLITQNCALWWSRAELCEVPDPFWAFYWPGGQALTRYILDNPSVVCDKHVLDIGSGCGAASIAAKLSGAKAVTANDICAVAATAISQNASLNNVRLAVTTKNYVGNNLSLQDCQVLLLGDMFYDDNFTDTISSWLQTLPQEMSVYIGDPGRATFTQHLELSKRLEAVARYELAKTVREENSGMTEGVVWKYANI